MSNLLDSMESSNGHTDPSQITLDDILEQEIENAGGPISVPNDGRIGVTMFDANNSKDNLIMVVVPKKDLSKLPSQALVRICSAKYEDGGDGREYQGIVVQGPFYEPDGLRADSSIIISTASQGVTFMPKYHGRVMVEIIGELVEEALIPPRFRPLPNSPVYCLSVEETQKVLNLSGDIIIGCAIGHADMEIKIPSEKKSVLARHLGILGTTGGGKSTTVSGIVSRFQQANLATILIDTEGEYTAINEPTDDPNMIKALTRRNLKPAEVNNTTIYHIVGREVLNQKHQNKKAFTLLFEKLSPYFVMEILDFNEAQEQRYLKAYDIARQLMRELSIFGHNPEDRKKLVELDELQEGYPKLTIKTMYDIVRALGQRAAGELKDESGNLTFDLISSDLKGKENQFLRIIEASEKPSHPTSWYKIQGELGKLIRLNIFDAREKASELDFSQLTKNGTVSIFDFSDVDSPKIRNLVIAQLLKGLMDKQTDNYSNAENNASNLPKVMVIIEEAHEFLSTQRIKQMPTLYEQVARIAKRGRKRWLGLTFVTQLPQHLPDEVLALINNFILHKVSDAGVISRLRRSIGGVDESMWDKLTNLSSGQAVVTFSHMRRAMLTAIDPTPCKLLMVD